METLCSVFARDHDQCDILFARACVQARSSEWDGAGASVTALVAALERHVEMEERIVFDALDAALGADGSGTATLRVDHRRIQGVLVRLLESQRGRDLSAFFKHAATLRVLLQSHHEKEEQVFYPAAERILRRERAKLVASLQGFSAAAA